MLEILAKHHNKWVRLALKFGAGSYAEDCVQQAYLKLHKYSNLNKLLNNNNEVHNGYMYLVIRNIVIDYFNARNKIIKIPIDDFFKDDGFKEIKAEYLPLFTDNTEIEINEQNAFWNICEKMDEELETWEWYDKTIFKIYRDKKISIRQLAKETDISWVNIFYTLKRCKTKMNDLFSEDYQDYKNKDYELL